MEECTPLVGGCNWNVSTDDWHNIPMATKEFPPLQLSGTEIVLSLYSCSMRLFAQSFYLLNLKFNFVGSQYIHSTYTEFQKKCSTMTAITSANSSLCSSCQNYFVV